jgi:DNA-binding XRE family transcriptional regulator
MNLQKIKSMAGRNEYVLLPIATYHVLKKQIDKALNEDYERFNLEDYVENPVALARIRAHLTQEELATYLKVSQAYISKIENQQKVSAKLIEKVDNIIERIAKK